MNILVFEDDRVPRLYPITIGRPAYAINCGGERLVDWLEQLEMPLYVHVREHLREIQRADFPQLQAGPPPHDQPLLVVNARLVPSRSSFQVLRQMTASARPAELSCDGVLAAAFLPDGLDLRSDLLRLGELARTKPLTASPSAEHALALLDYPHDVIRHHPRALSENLEYRLATGRYEEIADGVFVADSARLGQYVVTDTSQGPIVLEPGAQVGHYSFLSGPAHVGPAARVLEHASLKDAVALGHTTKIGGEVEASIVEAYTNKQHHGFLGHSYLGSWINLGAGTCNSDLKNTYGMVKMEYRGAKVATAMQFIGCIMGDYAKTAINTGIFTGKTVGACSMVYGFVTTNVPSFTNYARSFGQVTEMPPEVMIATQQRMFLRRNVTQRPCDAQLLRDMYALTRHERQMAGEPLSL